MKLAVVLHDIRSVHNVGSIFRTADAASVEKIYLCGITPSPFDRLKTLRPDFAKVALGAEEYVPWEVSPSTIIVIEQLKKDGYEVLALEQAENSVSYSSVNIHADSKIAIVLGAEVEGLSAEILAHATRVIEIPMRGSLARDVEHPKQNGTGKESLNVSVAFGVVAFGLRDIAARGASAQKMLKVVE
jgi:23S rRNA (guanosine2251-2'-O)-methyltransferase